MQKMKKGFTLTELAIVIAVIAILIAVLVPTFVSLINSAKLSADEQAVKNMNTALAASEATDGKPSNLADAQSVLSEAGFSTELIPTTSGYSYFWNSEYNIVLLLDLNDGAWDLIYPKTDDADKAYTQYISCCYNLDAKGTTTDQTAILEAVKKGNNITITADGGTDSDEIYKFSDIVTLANTYGETFAGATVMLTSDIKDYSGNPILNFQGTLTGYKDDSSNYSITVAKGGITPVYGENSNGYLYYEIYDGGEMDDQKVGYGLFASLTNGGKVEYLDVVYQDTVTFDTDGTTVTATSATNPDTKRTYFGGVAGFIDGGTISNCNVSGTIVQYNRVGGIVGTAFSGTIENCTVESSVYSLQTSSSATGYSEAGGIVAYVGNSGDSTYELNISGCIVGPSSRDSSNPVVISATANTGGIAAHITNGTKYVNLDSYYDGTNTVYTTVRNVDITSRVASAFSGAVCGKLETTGGELKGEVEINSVQVTNRSTAADYWYYNSSATNGLNMQKYSNTETAPTSPFYVIGTYAGTDNMKLTVRSYTAYQD